jgi:hypothetical protein
MTTSDGLLSKTVIGLQASRLSEPPSTIAAIGSTQGGAAAIAVGVTLAIITVTASTEGVILPEQVAFLNAGLSTITLIPKATVGFKLYPASGQGLNAVATNTAVVIASGKPVRVIPIQTGYGGSAAYRWAVEKGG